MTDDGTTASAAGEILGRFHPLIAQWFRESVGVPTDVQLGAWRRIAGGDHVLATAPTGCGKTFAAFLWAVDQLVTGKWPTGRTTVLYVSPLKALNNDVRRNLTAPLIDLERAFGIAGEPFPRLRVVTRSGDTPQSERRRMVRHPPEILITTPESLNILLNSPGGRSVLATVRTVILDEIHALVSSKRGVHLMAGVERLARLSGEFQRVALSATVRPLDTAAAFVGGYRLVGQAHVPRDVTVIESASAKRTEVSVEVAAGRCDAGDSDSVWPAVAAAVGDVIGRHRSTLVFTRTRRLCEHLTHLLNAGAQATIAYAHHGSLSREIRTEVERRMKAGDLRAIVATNSLELGIDVGSIDAVVLVQAPPGLSSAVQRIGRSGHRVGEVSRGEIFATHGHDLLEAAVVSRGVVSQDIEPLRPVTGALDVLAQCIVGLVTERPWDMDELYAMVRTCFSFHAVSRREFDLVLAMLAGRYAGTRIRELKPRLSLDRLDNTVRARKGVLGMLYVSGGTIPDRGAFHLRAAHSNTLIGELDEEFVWEARRGQTFTLGTQAWRIERITHNDVFVTPGSPDAAAAPFWRGEQSDRDWYFSERLGVFLEEAADLLDSPDLPERLREEHGFRESAIRECIDFLRRQREHTSRDIPHRHHVLVEHLATGPGGVPDDCQIVLHTVWGGRLNRPFSLALQGAFEARFGFRPECFAADDAIYLFLRDDVPSECLLSLVNSANLTSLLRQTLESSGTFGARFRECAGRALLLPRRFGRQRMPLWMNRLRSQRLLEAVSRYDDFPILLEAWRTCLRDEFDLENLRERLDELESGEIRWTETEGITPSPFAATTSWQQINTYMYRDDTPASRGPSRLTDDLLKEAVLEPSLRPRVSPETVAAFAAKRRRLAAGYSPDTGSELVEWIKERLVLPWQEWEALLDAVSAHHGIDAKAEFDPVFAKLAAVFPEHSSAGLVVAAEDLPLLRQALWPGCAVKGLHGGPTPVLPTSVSHPGEDGEPTAVDLLGQWLQYYGPLTDSEIADALGLPACRVDVLLEDLLDSEEVIAGDLIEGDSATRFCDSRNFETLLRLERAGRRPVFSPLPVSCLGPFLCRWQALQSVDRASDGVTAVLEQLACFPAQANLWETEFLPARLPDYSPADLDAAFQAWSLVWVGVGEKQIAFCYSGDLDLLGDGVDVRSTNGVQDGCAAGEAESAAGLFPDPCGRYPFRDLLRRAHAEVGGSASASGAPGPVPAVARSEPGGVSAATLSTCLWRLAWSGLVSNDTFAAIRRGLSSNFRSLSTSSGGMSEGTVPLPAGRSRRHRRRGTSAFPHWQQALPMVGNWFLLDRPVAPEDPIDRLELDKERARVLLDRYGIVFRELTARELPAVQWKQVFRALRLMELSGEAVCGCFVDGVSGPQFASREALSVLREEQDGDRIFWMNAADPASLCGVSLADPGCRLPRRLPTTHIVYRGNRVVMVSERLGKRLSFYGVEPTDADLFAIVAPLRHLLGRAVMPRRSIKIETIDGTDAASSPFAAAFRSMFDADVDHRSIVLFRRLSGTLGHR